MKINISHVAKLANLLLTPEEEKKYENQLSQILDYVNKLNKLDTKNVEPTFNVTGINNIYRKDTTSPSLSQDEAIKNASKKKNGLFVIEGVFKEK